MSLEPKDCKKPEVISGEDKVLTIQLKDYKAHEFYDLSGATEIIALFKNADSSTLQKKLTTAGIVMINALAGKFQIMLTAAETSLLAITPVGEYSDIELKVTVASKLTIVKFKDTTL